MTIGGRIFLSLLALFIVPALLLFGTGMAIRTYFAPSTTSSVREGGASDYLLVSGRVPSRLNRVLAENPDALADERQLEEFAVDHPTRGAVVARSGSVVAATSRFADLVGAPVDLIEGATVAAERGGDLTVFTVFAWDFWFADGTAGRFLYLGATGFAGRHFWPGGPLLTLATIALLLIVNGSISWLVARRVIGPLRGLEEAARRVGDGELDLALQPTGDREIRQVYHAFDVMRTKLADSLARQLAYERNRRELIAALSHDLRTPISSIRGYVEGLKDGIPRSDEDRRRYLDTIEEKARLLDRLIGELFVYSRSDIEGVQLRQSPVDLVALLAEAAREAMHHHPTLAVTVAPAAGETPLDAVVSADRDHLRRAILNIAENVVMHAGVTDPTLRISVTRDGGNAVIELCDNGRGVADDLRERIFDGFFRGDESRTSERPGAGLGLTVVRQVVEAHGGTVRACGGSTRAPREPAHPPGVADDGRGLCVVISLPSIGEPA